MKRITTALQSALTPSASLDWKDPKTLTRLAAILALLGFLLPWFHLDTHADPISGSELTFYFLTVEDRSVMTATSRWATWILMALPIVIAYALAKNVYSTLRSKYSLDAPVFAFLAVLLICRTAGPLLAPGSHSLIGFTIPGPGLFLILIATLPSFYTGFQHELAGGRWRYITRADARQSPAEARRHAGEQDSNHSPQAPATSPRPPTRRAESSVTVDDHGATRRFRIRNSGE